MKTLSLLLAVLVATPAVAFAQQPPAQQSSIVIDGNTIKVTYSAPSMKGRRIFGGVVPYNRAWRIGENAAAAFHTDADITFRTLNVLSGDYTLWVMTAPDGWKLIVSAQTGPTVLVYDPKMDVGRVALTLAKSTAPIERCRLTLTKTAPQAGKLELAWENTVASVPFFLDLVPDSPAW